jgi:subtilisin-like proprotein convertase family protein
MRRTSPRKSALNKSKLLNSIRPTEQRLCMQIMETLETRTLFAVSNLPAPIAGSAYSISQQAPLNDLYSSQIDTDSSAPSVAIDLNNPNKMVAVWTDHLRTVSGQPFQVNASYSTDGGKSWQNLSAAVGVPVPALDLDPDTSNPVDTYQSSQDASVGIDRNDNVYIVSRELSGVGSGGEIVLQRFDFSGSTPTLSAPLLNAENQGTQQVLYQWTKTGDQALSPMLAVDNNVASFTEKDSNGNTFDQTDPYGADPTTGRPGNVYVAWATQDVLPKNAKDTQFNTNLIRMIASSDGANTFTSPVPVSGTVSNASGAYNRPGVRAAEPRLVVSQGSPDRGVAPGQVTVVWDGFDNTARNAKTDVLMEDVLQGAVSYSAGENTPTPITDADKGQNGAPDTPETTPIDLTSQIQANPLNDPNFDLTGLTDISVNLNIQNMTLADLDIQLVTPAGLIPLLLNKNNEDGSTNNNQGVTGTSLNVTFSDSAARIITEGTGAIGGTYQAEGGLMMPALKGMTEAQLNGGPWGFLITDHKNGGNSNNNQSAQIVSASINFTSGLNPGGGADKTIPAGLNKNVRGSLTGNYSLKTSASPNQGVGPGLVIAADNTLGAYSEFSGRLYVAYTDQDLRTNTAGKTVVKLMYSDDGGQTWQTSLSDNGAGVVAPQQEYIDGYSQDFRPQFMPQIAVDQATGTVVVSMYDTRNDGAQARVGTLVTASNDGGDSFSNVTFANAEQTAIDAITDKPVNIGPVPDNISSGNPNTDTSMGFGTRQGLAVYAGNVVPVWTGNINGNHSTQVNGDAGNTKGNNHLEIYTNVLTIPAGPRVLTSTMGAVGEPGDSVNNTRTVDGTPIVSKFIITFDRPIDPNSFTKDDVKVTFRTPTTAGTDPGQDVPVLTVVPVATSEILDPVTQLHSIGFTQFVVNFTPNTSVGTYSYTVGPTISDRIRTVGLRIPVQTTTSFPSTDTPVTIPANSFQGSSVLNVTTAPQNQLVGNVKVTVNIANSFDQLLNIELMAPSGNTITLASGVGGGGKNFTGTIFDDTAATSIANGSAPFTGSFRPQQALSNLIGETPNGTWTLIVTNGTGAPVTIQSWNLALGTGPSGVGQVDGNTMDQNGNGVNSEDPGDIYTTLDASNQTQLPLIIPGPHVVLTAPVGQSATVSSLVADTTNPNALDLTFNRPVKPASFTPSKITSITVTPQGGSATPINGPFTVVGLDSNGVPTTAPTTRFLITTPAAVPAGTYAITLKPGIATDDVFMGAAAAGIDVTFDRDMKDSSISGASVLNILGPNGPVTGPFNMVNLDTTQHRTYRITFPGQTLNGLYSVQLSSDIQSAAGDKMDPDLNAGLDVLRGVPSAGTAPINYKSSDTPLTISNVKPARSTIHVSDSFPIQGVLVQLNITHPLDTDMIGTLIAPDGTRVTLFTHVGSGGTHANFTDTIFDENATTPVSSGGAPFFGAYIPQQSFATKLGNMSAKGDWTLEIVDDKAQNNGVLNNWNLTLVKPLSLTGLGQVSDRTTTVFRVFDFGKGSTNAQNTWTALGPASVDDSTSGTTVAQGGAGAVTAIAVDPSDPSGNTVYVGGAGGGVWKTTDFLTHDPAGPRYVPLIDAGPTNGLSVGSIAIFARNNDPEQSIIFVATGDGNENSPGAGILRSLDGGKTWIQLDSTVNFDTNGNLLPSNSSLRDHAFEGTTSFKIVVDPNFTPTGDVVVYAALSNGSTTNGGLWRSLDTGKTWTLLKSGNATDVILDQNSATASSNNLQGLFAAFAGDGVYYSANRGQAINKMLGGAGDGLLQDPFFVPPQAIPVTNTGVPNGAFGRIVLAKPALVVNGAEKNVAENIGYEGWLYAAVSNTDGSLQGLYLTKDFGANWTKVQLPEEKINNLLRFAPTGNGTDPNYDPIKSNEARGGNYALSLAVDPTNPNIVYLGGSDDRRLAGSGMLRIDVTKLYDAYSDVAYDRTQPDGGAIDKNSAGRMQIEAAPRDAQPYVELPSNPNVIDTTQYINLLRDPNSPFVGGANSTILLGDVNHFTNTGLGATWTPFDKTLDHNSGIPASVVGSDFHTIITVTDPVTGLPRLLMGNDNGIFTVEDNNGIYFSRSIGPDFATAGKAAFTPAGASDPIEGPRNGNLQLAQFHYGAVQPSEGASTTGYLYGGTEGLGAPQSNPDVLETGDINWSTSNNVGKVIGVATDQQGKGTVYEYVEPTSATTSTDFFLVNGVSQTFGLVQDSQPGLVPDPQWPYFSNPVGDSHPTPGNFTVNPLNGNQVIISSAAGRIFLTENKAAFWSVIGNPTDLDGTYAPALAFGAPDPSAPSGIGNLDNFIYAGTSGGKIFVTLVGGGGVNNNWINISNGLDGSRVQQIVTDPVRGSRDAYAVTDKGVYFAQLPLPANDNLANNPAEISAKTKWTLINGQAATGLFTLTRSIFNDTTGTQVETPVKQLTSILADWRYSIPDTPTLANSPTHPVLYVGTNSGVYRSVDKGATWLPFPNASIDGGQTGGALPDAPVSDLDFSLGNINPTTGEPTVSTGQDLLVASTFGRGSYGIRVAPLVINLGLPGGGTTSANTTPTMIGYTEQTAFGNKTHVKLFDVTNGSPVLIGEADTDTSGKFNITTSVLTAGPHTIVAQATDDAGVTGPQSTITINVNGAPAPTLSIADVSMSEGNSGTTAFIFNVTLSAASLTPVMVNYATEDGTATAADNDYNPVNGTLTFAPGVTTQQITVNVNGDTKVEPNETFLVTLSTPVGATLQDAQATGTIVNDDAAPNQTTLMITSNVTHDEGNSGTTPFVFTVTLSQAQATPVTVQFATADGTANAGSDYTATSGTLTFAPGQTSKQITVNVNGDTMIEPDETFYVNLSNATNGIVIVGGQGLGTITNDDAPPTPPTISINDVTHLEGNSGITPYVFTVSLSHAAASTVLVNYATANDTALSTSDYQSTSGTLTFQPGQTSQQITVNVNGDTLVESDEDFFVNLSAPFGATIADSQGVGTIINDDPTAPTLSGISIGNVTKAEGNSGTTAFVFNVTLDKANSNPVTVKYATADGTANAGSDYTAASGTLTFAPGVTSQQITVNVTGDTIVEPDETFFVNLTNASSNATINTAQGTGTITNDDTAAQLPTISINDVIAHEGTSADLSITKPFVFTVTLSAASSTPVTVAYTTADGTATVADNDYKATSGTLTFAPGVTSQQIIVPVVQDSKVEGDETFFVNLSSPTGATIADAQGQATVQNDDVAGPTPSKITINNVAKSEGNSGTTSFTFTVTLDHAQAGNVTVKYATANGTASSGSDYTSTSGTLTFTPGQVSKTITVKVTGDTTQESDELFFVNLSGASANATIADTQGVGTIRNDDSTSSSKVSVVTDQTDSTKTELRVWGTSSNDTIALTQVGTGQGKVKVTINGSNKGTFSFTGGIVVFGQDGNDKITIASGITRPVYAFGGYGNDSIFAGGGPSVLEGEAGDDSLVGGTNRDILIGGDGTDMLNGGGGDDIVMPGDFINNYSFSVLNGLQKEWTRTDATYAQRVTHIENGGGLNGQLLNKNTCFSSIALKDTVTGGAGSDLFLVAVAGDVITDAMAGETITDIGI